MIDLESLTFVGLVAIGAVNVASFFKPSLDPRVKFMIAFLVAFGLTFVPVDLGNLLLERAKEALGIAFASSGAYKLATKAGGN